MTVESPDFIYPVLHFCRKKKKKPKQGDVKLQGFKSKHTHKPASPCQELTFHSIFLEERRIRTAKQRGWMTKAPRGSPSRNSRQLQQQGDEPRAWPGLVLFHLLQEISPNGLVKQCRSHQAELSQEKAHEFSLAVYLPESSKIAIVFFKKEKKEESREKNTPEQKGKEENRGAKDRKTQFS